MSTPPPFHLAIPVDDLVAARDFYGGVLGLSEGRSAERWIDWDLRGHQLVTHVTGDAAGRPPAHNPVDGHAIPVPHFGVVLTIPEFHELADRLRGHDVDFVVEPYERFAGEPGEQWTMFLLDPAGNAIEFKAFRDRAQLFAT
ncbi:VOC family protein [Patulibacter sp.]|uniref:VOC family protein n=1 Tax=Patulibacter sp. TaxID=1912859 RepID=UPI00271F87CD|nr:VOC family protein [Patulibacter sp.]MDO9408872.1 VOC family protein [Patulibacter sp.]